MNNDEQTEGYEGYFFIFSLLKKKTKKIAKT